MKYSGHKLRTFKQMGNSYYRILFSRYPLNTSSYPFFGRYFSLMKETTQEDIDELFQVLLHTRSDSKEVSLAFKRAQRKRMREDNSIGFSEIVTEVTQNHLEHNSTLDPDEVTCHRGAAQPAYNHDLQWKLCECDPKLLEANLRDSWLYHQRIEVSSFFSDERLSRGPPFLSGRMVRDMVEIETTKTYDNVQRIAEKKAARHKKKNRFWV